MSESAQCKGDRKNVVGSTSDLILELAQHFGYSDGAPQLHGIDAPARRAEKPELLMRDSRL